MKEREDIEIAENLEEEKVPINGKRQRGEQHSEDGNLAGAAEEEEDG
jgi:hypothetical protein